ncbi:MAG: heme-dependent oxidative N-demethylase family protein [Hyphomicrobiales bacterium]
MHEFSEICQARPRVCAWMDPSTGRLPGVNPLTDDDWLFRDGVFAEQMAYRDWLVEHRRDVVFKALDEVGPAAVELLSVVTGVLVQREGYEVGEKNVVRPDGVRIALDDDHPLLIAGRLTQHDLCVMEKLGDEHVLMGASLFFPSSWSLEEKVGRPLITIHIPIEEYTEDIATRVQRMFDMIRVDRPLWRANTLIYENPDLHQPRPSGTRDVPAPDQRLWLRSEFQGLKRLPDTDAVVFSIHNSVVPFETLSDKEQSSLKASRHWRAQ